MFRNAADPDGEGATRAVMRSLVAALAITAFSSVCFAELAMGPTLAPSQSLHGRFTQSRNLKGIAAPLKSSGSFVLSPGKGLIWRVESPIQTTTVITPAGIRQIINGNEVQRIEAAKVPFVAHFYDMMNGALMGDWTAMRHDFAVSTTGDRRAWRTVLTPLRPNDPIAGMLASIVISGGQMVDSVDINRANGDSEQIRFMYQVVSTALSTEGANLLDNKRIRPAN